MYIEVGDKDSAEAIDAPNTTYYFSSQIFGDSPLIIDNVDGRPVDLKADVTFSFSLHIGEAFGVWDDKETGLSIILKGEEMEEALQLTGVNGGIDTRFEMLQLYRNENDGKLYIDLNQQGYEGTGLYLGGTGEDGTFGGQYSGGLAYEKDGVMEFTSAIQAPGDGSALNPYKIRSRHQMDWITGEVLNGNDFAGKHF